MSIERFMDDKEGSSYSPPPEETGINVGPPHHSPTEFRRHVLTHPLEAQNPGIPGTPRRRSGLGQQGEIPRWGTSDNVETVFVETAGGPRAVEIPQDPEEKREFVRNALERLEQTRQQDGGPTVRQSIERANIMVNALQDPEYINRHPERDDLNRTIGEELARELNARYWFHQTFIKYDSASNVEAVQGAVSEMQADWLNTLFSLDEFTEALNYYEQFGEEFTEKTRDDFRLGYYFYRLQGHKPTPGEFNEFKKNLDTYEISQQIARLRPGQNLGERYWQIGGRRATQDQQDTSKGDWEQTGEFKFSDDLVGGNFYVRRILRWKDWLKSQGKSMRPVVELVGADPRKPGYKDISLDEKDYFQMIKDRMQDSIDGQFEFDKPSSQDESKTLREIIKGFEKEWDNNNRLLTNHLSAEDKRAREEKKAEEVRVQLSPEDQNSLRDKFEAIKVEYPGLELNQLSEVFPDGKIQFNLRDKDGVSIWKKLNEDGTKVFDFRSFGNDPMNFWSFRYLAMPDKARDALTKDSSSYLRNPNPDSLAGTIDIFDYQADKRWAVKLDMVENWDLFAATEIDKETGRPKYPLDRRIGVINDLTGFQDDKRPRYIHLQEREKLIEVARARGSLRERIWLNKGVKGSVLFAIGSAWGLLEWIWQQIRKG